jgi:hypothetical protein
MSLFHRHHWQEVARRFVPPVNRTAKNLPHWMVYDFANGYTVVELRCSECGDVTSRKLRGDAT